MSELKVTKGDLVDAVYKSTDIEKQVIQQVIVSSNIICRIALFSPYLQVENNIKLGKYDEKKCDSVFDGCIHGNHSECANSCQEGL